MSRNPRYNLLFEPVQIGPVTAKNRFYQTPHATGMGCERPESLIAFRETKAEGGWGVVCTDVCYVHPTTDVSPYTQLTLYDDEDERLISALADSCHQYGALAGIELAHAGYLANNRMSRAAPLSPSGLPSHAAYTFHPRAMDKQDISSLRQWLVAAGRRAKRAGMDIIYVYAGHESLPFQFLNRRTNHRSDEYGGSLNNRTRLLRELIDDMQEVVGDKCAVAVRLSVEELMGDQGIAAGAEGQDIVESLAELPDLWDICMSYIENDSASSRFEDEGYEEPYVNFVKQVTSKPVVGVGRFTSPDTMVRQVKSGILDFIGAARPAIADPFIPQKIDQGRIEDIRECIGCNICRSAHNSGVTLRCTQNPAVGEEWRRGWHPEQVPAKVSDKTVLVVGGGPAGLEAAHSFARRDYNVTLAEASDSLGGRVTMEVTHFPGLTQWSRVRDYRVYQLHQQAHVEIYLNSHMDTNLVREFDADHVVIATGAGWRGDGIGSHNLFPIGNQDQLKVYTPDDIFAGIVPEGPVCVIDDENFYYGGCVAESLNEMGLDVTYVTSAPMVSEWTVFTDEQAKIHTRLIDRGIGIQTNLTIASIDSNGVTMHCVYSGQPKVIGCETVMLVTARQPNDDLYRALAADGDEDRFTLECIGDCHHPGAIVDAVYAGRKSALEFEMDPSMTTLRRERGNLIRDCK